MKTRTLLIVYLISIMALLASCKSGLGNTSKNPLTGTSWVFQLNANTKVVKVFSDKIFVVYVINKDGIMQTQHSGTYEIKGEDLTEVIRHASPDRQSWIGRDATLKVDLKDNKMRSTGKINSPGFGQIVEEWTRIESSSQMLK